MTNNLISNLHLHTYVKLHNNNNKMPRECKLGDHCRVIVVFSLASDDDDDDDDDDEQLYVSDSWKSS